LGVAAVTYGAGALNMVNAVAAAYAEKSPLVVLSGGPGKGESRSGLLLHHQAKTLDSQFQIFREITCDQVRLDDAARAPADIARVLGQLPCAIREPVYIEIPRDMVESALRAGAADCRRARSTPTRSRPASTRSCARLAQAAVAGADGRRRGAPLRAGRQGRELARRLGLPVVTSFMGRGLLADADAPLIGTYMGRCRPARGDANWSRTRMACSCSG
jgi:indolepyruvate decarboxylase